MNKHIHVQDLGLKDYKETWDYQEQLFKGIVDTKIKNRREDAQLETDNYFLFVEHPHVYTLGKSGDVSNLLLNEEQLTAKGATFYKINRGGDITYHGPGQLVVYPIIDLRWYRQDIHWYMRALEETIIRALDACGVKATRDEDTTGVWVDNKKVAATTTCCDEATMMMGGWTYSTYIAAAIFCHCFIF